jgi:ATP synthase protein I
LKQIVSDSANFSFSTAYRVIGLQLLSSVLAAVLYLYRSGWEAVSAFYGGLISVIVALVLSWGVYRAGRAALSSPGKSLAILYVGAVQRFVLVIGLFALGLAVFKFNPIAVCIGFALAQLSYLISSRHQARVV